MPNQRTFFTGGSCKTTAPQKIDDFSTSSLGQQAGLCRANEVILEQVDEVARREMALKGRFYVVHEFCNCLTRKPIASIISSAGWKEIGGVEKVAHEMVFWLKSL